MSIATIRLHSGEDYDVEYVVLRDWETGQRYPEITKVIDNITSQVILPSLELEELLLTNVMSECVADRAL